MSLPSRSANARVLLGMMAVMLVLGVSGRDFATTALARPDPSPSTQTLEQQTVFPGIITCSKCDLKRTVKCGTVLQPRDGRNVYYPFDDVSNKKYHRFICVQAVKGVVIGKLAEKDGRVIIVVERVQFD